MLCAQPEHSPGFQVVGELGKLVDGANNQGWQPLVYILVHRPDWQFFTRERARSSAAFHLYISISRARSPVQQICACGTVGHLVRAVGCVLIQCAEGIAHSIRYCVLADPEPNRKRSCTKPVCKGAILAAQELASKNK